ncbi:hypothetical protein SCAR479_03012 [Seiridium cardinale]|uniref:Uncharacterized protein n=1 Tax=Seiridium cardinale TaxID=138064 RepID=A0ABR2Y2R9_9PEZI
MTVTSFATGGVGGRLMELIRRNGNDTSTSLIHPEWDHAHSDHVVGEKDKKKEKHLDKGKGKEKTTAKVKNPDVTPPSALVGGVYALEGAAND